MGQRALLKKYDRKVAMQKPENDLDKIKIWYWQQDTELLAHDQIVQLTPTQLEKKDRLFKIWGWLIDKPSEEVVNAIKKEYELEERQARNLIRQSQELFGFIKEINVQAQRNLRIDQREHAIRMIKESTDLSDYEKQDLIHKNMERIEKMIGLDRPEAISMDELLELLQLPDTSFTTDINALTEDIDHEEVDE